MSRNDSVRPRQARDVHSWDIETDVVIAGFGGAGTGAAIESARQGVDTLVVERTSGGGGSSAMSGGYVYTGGGTALQKACGVEDTPENMYNFLMAATGPNPNEERVRVYCEEGVSYFDWLLSLGIPYKERLYDGPAWQVPRDYGLIYSGGENAYPWNEIATPAARAHVAYMEGWGGDAGPGSVVMNHLMASASELGIKHEFDLRVDRLVMESDGRVAGVIGQRYGEEIAVRARRGVVLTAGGFMNNDDMKRQHAPHLLGLTLTGTEGDDGRAIRMAQAVGAAVQLMDRGECAIAIDAPLLFPSMMVNLQGQRFINEDTYPGRVGQAILTRQGGRGVAVFDEEIFNSWPAENRVMETQPTWVCETIEELEQSAGIPKGALQMSVDFYNRHAANGEDPMFHKNPRWLRPLKSPFGAIDLGKDPATLFSFTLGGLVTKASGEVLDVDGEPIPGLYAAGRTVSGIPAAGYLSGASLGDAIFFGRKSGKSAAAFSG